MTLETFTLQLDHVALATESPSELEKRIEQALTNCHRLLRWAIVKTEPSADGLLTLFFEGAYLRY